MKNLKTILDLSTDFLKKHEVTGSRLIAEVLLSHFLDLKRIELYMHFDRPLVEEELEPFRKALKRAASHEPVDYIVGEVEFYHTKIKVGPQVLIPRQETEILIDKVCQSLNSSEKRALDLCTGSGCIAASLKQAKPYLEVVGVDLSEEALSIARQNSNDVEWIQGDLTQPVQGQKFDLVICNPPYVSEGEYEGLDQGVKNFEPKMALVSGSTGLEFYERLEKELPDILSPGAKVFFEIGTGQGESIRKIFSTPKWENLQLESDWAGHDRFFWLNLKDFSSIIH